MKKLFMASLLLSVSLNSFAGVGGLAKYAGIWVSYSAGDATTDHQAVNYKVIIDANNRTINFDSLGLLTNCKSSINMPLVGQLAQINEDEDRKFDDLIKCGDSSVLIRENGKKLYFIINNEITTGTLFEKAE